MKKYELISLTIREIFNRCHDWRQFQVLNINEWYLNEGGDPDDTKTFGRKAAEYMGIEDFDIRSYISKYEPDLTDEEFDKSRQKYDLKYTY